jgi:hypothetical protein
VTFIGAALLLIAGVFGALGGLAGMATANVTGQKLPLGFPAFLFILYIPFALLYLYPGMKLWGYASAISRLALSRSPQDLEAALGQQKSFWKFAGILTMVVIILYVILAAVAIVAIVSKLPHQ